MWFIYQYLSGSDFMVKLLEKYGFITVMFGSAFGFITLCSGFITIYGGFITVCSGFITAYSGFITVHCKKNHLVLQHRVMVKVLPSPCDVNLPMMQI